jgi:hypothetical protein
MTPQITLQVYDQAGNAYDLHLVVREQTEQGTLTLRNPQGEVIQQFELAHLQKSQDGTAMACRVGLATATMTIDTANQPRLHIVARALLPLFQATYTLSDADRQRLRTWIQTLTLQSV